MSAPETSPVGSASPLVIGTSFIKQYYRVLSTTPEHVRRFYDASSSSISHGFEPSAPTRPETLEHARFDWAESLRFDFERGAIDAQETIGGGILLVVTGRMTSPTTKSRSFVHTFFLNNGAPPGRKRQFYVHNDILRFLSIDDDDAKEDPPEHNDPPSDLPEPISPPDEPMLIPDEPKQSPDEPKQPLDEPKPSHDEPKHIPDELTSHSHDLHGEPDQLEEPAQPDEPDQPDLATIPAPPPTEEQTHVIAIDAESMQETTTITDTAPTTPTPAPTIIEETQHEEIVSDRAIDPPDDEVELPAVAVVDAPKDTASLEDGKDEKDEKAKAKKTKHQRRANRNRASRSNSPPTDPPKGSWASLVAGGAKPDAVEESKEVENTDGIDGAKASSKQPPRVRRAPANNQPHNRVPDATLFIKNVPDRTKESDIRAIFEPFATGSSHKILQITLSAGRGFCFVDFDSPDVVTAIVDNEHQPFSLHGRLLDVGRKVALDNKHRGGRYRHRSASPANNGAFKHRPGYGRTSPRGSNRTASNNHRNNNNNSTTR